MSLLFRLLGYVAYYSGKMSRFHGNGLPMNFWIILGLGMFLFISAETQPRDARAHGKPPHPITVADALKPLARQGQYVRLSGSLHPEETLVVQSSASQTRFVPLADEASGQAVLVKVDADFPRTPGKREITGMLRSVDSRASKAIADAGGKLGKFTIATDFQLVAGETPFNPGWFPLTMVALGVPLLLLLTVACMRHVVFQPLGKTLPPIPNLSAHTRPDALDMRVSGRFSLEPKISGRFENVPSGLATLESGERAIIARIDATETHQGMVTEERVGIWTMIIKPGSWTEDAYGMLYNRDRGRPALRARFINLSRDREEKATAYLSFADEAERDWFRWQMSRPSEEVLTEAKARAEEKVRQQEAEQRFQEQQAQWEREAVGVADAPAAEPAAEPGPTAREPFKPYTASNGIYLPGVPILLAMGAVGGVGVGLLYHWITQFTDLVIFFPFLFGAVAGGVVTLGVRAGKCRHAGAAALAGLVAGLTVYGTRLVAESQQVRPEIVASLVTGLSKLPDKPADLSTTELRARVERHLDPWKTLQLYLSFREATGVHIGNTRSSSVYREGPDGGETIREGAKIHFTGAGFWFFILAETVTVALVAAGIASVSAKHPFCDESQRWLNRHRILRVNPKQAPLILEKIEARDWNGLKAIQPEGHIGDQYFADVYVAYRPGSPTATLQVKIMGNSQNKELLHVQIDEETAHRLHAPLA